MVEGSKTEIITQKMLLDQLKDQAGDMIVSAESIKTQVIELRMDIVKFRGRADHFESRLAKLEKIVYGSIALVMTAVIAALVALVIK